jgi:rhodanese-related sulfurtransferase
MSAEPTQLSPRDLAKLLGGENPPRLLDVREPEEHQFAALPGSTLIPLRQIPDRADQIADWKDKDVVVYCHHGVRSLQAIGWLRQLGFTKLRNLTGGIDLWSHEVDASVPRY